MIDLHIYSLGKLFPELASLTKTEGHIKHIDLQDHYYYIVECKTEHNEKSENIAIELVSNIKHDVDIYQIKDIIKAFAQNKIGHKIWVNEIDFSGHHYEAGIGLHQYQIENDPLKADRRLKYLSFIREYPNGDCIHYLFDQEELRANLIRLIESGQIQVKLTRDKRDEHTGYRNRSIVALIARDSPLLDTNSGISLAMNSRIISAQEKKPHDDKLVLAGQVAEAAQQKSEQARIEKSNEQLKDILGDK